MRCTLHLLGDSAKGDRGSKAAFFGVALVPFRSYLKESGAADPGIDSTLPASHAGPNFVHISVCP